MWGPALSGLGQCFYGCLFTWTRPHLCGAGLEETFKSKLNGPHRTSSNLYKMAQTVATHSYRTYIFAATFVVRDGVVLESQVCAIESDILCAWS